MGGAGRAMGGERARFFCCSCIRCLQDQDLAANVRVGEGGGGGGLIEVEGGVVGEGEARFHPIGKVRVCVLSHSCFWR